MTARCIVLLGGSFDPVHQGHVAIAGFFCSLLRADELRLIPAGNPWQKSGLHATPEQRVAMLKLAFKGSSLPVKIDTQEIERQGPTYTIETLQALRREVGNAASLVFIIGADQLKQFNTWRSWRELFDYAHICVAARPGFSLFEAKLPKEVAEEFYRRKSMPEKIRQLPHGLTYVAAELSLAISATEIRAALRQGLQPSSLVPAAVLDYVEKSNIYKE